jgi:hypothetical protein
MINLILWNLKQRDHIIYKYLASDVYKLPRLECSKVYVGQTGCTFTKRFKEHLLLFINNYSISKFAQNLLENSQSYGKLKNHSNPSLIKKSASFLKPTAEPVSEKLCLSVFKYLLDDGQGPREEYCI